LDENRLSEHFAEPDIRDILQILAYSPLVAVGIVVLKLGAGKGVRDYDHLSYLAGKK
jgi:hypothetical protein